MIVDIVNGFLGSGKTTFIQNIIRQINPLEKVVILVNEFGEVGIDGVLLAKDGLDVVELTSGCVCCTLAPDLAAQLLGIATRIKPDRVIIEPTGVATVQGLLSIVGSLRLEKYVEAVKVILLLDAADVQNYHGAYPMFLESQIAHADVVVVNKSDLVSSSAVKKIQKAVSGINRRSSVIVTTFGQVTPDQMDTPPDPGDYKGGGGGECSHHHRHLEQNFTEGVSAYQSFSREYPGIFDMKKLKAFFYSLSQSEVIRAKGIFFCAGGWRRVDYVPSAGVTVKELKESYEKSRVLIIGRNLGGSRLDKKLLECLELLNGKMEEQK